QYSRQVIFVDNMFDGDLKHAAALLERIIAEKLKPQMTIFCRSSIGKHPALLKLMKRAGVMRIFMGVESLNQESLDSVTKRQSVAEIQAAVREIRRCGISVLSTLIMGFDTDTVDSLRTTRRMLHELGLSQMNVFALWGFYPHKGVRLTPVERIIFKDWAYLNGSYVCHLPMRVRPSQVQREIMATYEDSFAADQPHTDYPRWSGRDAPWEPVLREIWRVTRPTMVDYIPFLEETERGLYDDHDNLILDKLPSRPDLDWVRYNMQ
ncbi:MAG: radical SAM protein, partial [Planctomycetota bacterium]